MLEDFVGFGALGEALLCLGDHHFKRAFIVASVSGWRRFNAREQRALFTGMKVKLFSGFSNNPDFSEIQAGCEAFKAFQPDLLVALGGGSPMDVAKAVKALAFTREPFDPARPETIKPSGDGPPLVAIPTTAGTGSEATPFAVFYVGEVKQSLSHPSLRPEMAVVDPEMSYTLPPDQTAATGFDALSQLVEAHWAAASTPEARELTRAGIRYVLPNLQDAVAHPAPGNRYNMAQAAYLSGKAIAITRTTMPHALAYHLTKRYHLPHGHAVALTLPFFFRLNLDPEFSVAHPGGPEAHRRNMEELLGFFGQKNGEGAFRFWRGLMRSCGLAHTFAAVGLTERAQFETLAANANPARMGNHPVVIPPDRLVGYFMEHDGEGA